VRACVRVCARVVMFVCLLENLNFLELKVSLWDFSTRRRRKNTNDTNVWRSADER